MSLVLEQWAFVRDVGKLISFAEITDVPTKTGHFALTFGEAYRTLEQQKIHVANGNSKTMNSRHLTRLAIDFNIFFDVDGDGDLDLVEREKDVKEIASVLGDFWCSLSPKNLWGFSAWGWDSPHFERRV